MRKKRSCKNRKKDVRKKTVFVKLRFEENNKTWERKYAEKKRAVKKKMVREKSEPFRGKKKGLKKRKRCEEKGNCFINLTVWKKISYEKRNKL
jgi:hypothetical protein